MDIFRGQFAAKNFWGPICRAQFAGEKRLGPICLEPSETDQGIPHSQVHFFVPFQITEILYSDVLYGIAYTSPHPKTLQSNPIQPTMVLHPSIKDGIVLPRPPGGGHSAPYGSSWVQRPNGDPSKPVELWSQRKTSP